jgi:Flp pilus assembly protein TadD
VRASNKVGTILLRQGDTERAIAAFQDTLARDPEHGPALLNLGSASLAAGNWEDARAALEKLAALDPTDARPDLLLGQLDESLGDLASAERRYRAALALAPESPDVRSRLALLLWKTGRDAEAAALERGE